MSGDIHRASDILPHHFYTQAPTDHQEMVNYYEQMRDQSTISRSSAEIANDPASLSAALYLPLLSFVDFQEFLTQGRSWFESFGTTGPGVGATTDQAKDKQHEMMINMLNGWHEALEKEAVATKIAEKKKDLQLSPLQQLLDAELAALKSAGISGLGESEARIGALGAYISQVGLNPEAAKISTNSAVQGAWNVVQPMVDSGVSKQAGMAVGFHSTLAANQMAILTPAILRTLSAESKGLNAKEAKAHAYVMLILQQVTSSKFDVYVQNVIRGTGGAARLYNKSQMLRMLTATKLSMLMSGLALLYKAETGGLTSIEIGHMVQGKMKIPDDSMLGVVIKMIHLQLYSLPESIFPASVREKILLRMFEWFDSNPDVEDLYDASNAFDGILGSSVKLHGFIHPA